MKSLKFLTAAVFASFAAAAVYAAPFGPGPGCPAGAAPGSADCPAYGSGNGPGAGCGQRGARFAERMRAADTNADGMLSRAEVQASLPGLAARFDTIDANADGNITYAEMQAAGPAYGRGARGQGWTKWDANGDGQLSREEVANAPRLSQDFDAIDADHNGFVTADELQAARGQFTGRGGRRGS